MADNAPLEGIAKARASRWTAYHANPGAWFWDKVDRSAGADGCWPWKGRIEAHRRGYGRIDFKRRLISAHKMALIIASGEPPSPSHVACHTCDNPPCCNPAHLWWGTTAENDRDARMKGRKRGHARKIDRAELARLRAEGLSYSKLAAHFHVNQASIGKALRALSSQVKS